MSATLIKPGQKFTNIGSAFVVVGLLVFAAHHCVRSLAPQVFEKAYPSCDTQPSVTLTRSTSHTLVLRNDCWSRGIQSDFPAWLSPNTGLVARCSDGKIVSLPVTESFECAQPVRYRSIDETLKLTVSVK